MTRDSRSTLLASLHAFVGDERRLVAKCIAYLIEVERRRLDLEMACTSMTDFCQRKLGLSGGQTHRRLTAARLVRRFPQLLSAIAEGRIHLSNLEILAPLFTSDVEADALIANAAGKSKAETQALFAQRRPRPDVPESMTKVEEQVPLGGSPVAAPPAATQPRCLGRPEPLSEERYRLTLTVSAEVHGQIERARALSRHTNLRGDLEPILAQAMALLVAKLERDKLGKTKRPRKSRGTADPADATAATKREVYERDDEQCAYVSMEGERCPARELLEIDHAHPRALGGEGDAANLRVLCRAHNRREAEKIFGSDFIESRIHLRQRRSRSASAAKLDQHPDGAAAANSAEPAAARTGRPEQQQAAPTPRECVRTALVSMGFRPKDADQAIAAIAPAAWTRPLETLVRDALGRLT